MLRQSHPGSQRPALLTSISRATLNRQSLAPRGFVRLWQFRSSRAAAEAAQNHGPLWRDADLARVEAALFLSREPLGSRRIAELADLADGTQARTLIRRLNQLYGAAGAAVRVEEVAGGYQLLTRPVFALWLKRIANLPVEARLSAPAMETLAVVAYRQPILRAEIESIRGVGCEDILRQLLERDLVRIVGRSEDLGRPLLYGTTKRFLEVYGLRSLDELPRAAELKQSPGSLETPVH
jgi:segregation and condensation protein B